MFNYFSRKKEIPEFETLKSFDKKDFYFIRTATWDWVDKNNIVVYDPLNPRLLTLDPWPQIVFIGANGQYTIREYVYNIAGDYKNEIPSNLDKAIIDEVFALAKLGIIELSESKMRPRPEFELPKSDKNYLGSEN